MAGEEDEWWWRVRWEGEGRNQGAGMEMEDCGGGYGGRR